MHHRTRMSFLNGSACLAAIAQDVCQGNGDQHYRCGQEAQRDLAGQRQEGNRQVTLSPDPPPIPGSSPDPIPGPPGSIPGCPCSIPGSVPGFIPGSHDSNPGSPCSKLGSVPWFSPCSHDFCLVSLDSAPASICGSIPGSCGSNPGSPGSRAAQIELLHLLAGISGEHNLGQGMLVKIKFNIIASLYDYNPNLAAFMKVTPKGWRCPEPVLRGAVWVA